MKETDRLGTEVQVGDRVRYVPNDIDDAVVAWGQNADPRKMLDPARSYVVARADVHASHTKVWLEDAIGPFNSVHVVCSPDEEVSP